MPYGVGHHRPLTTDYQQHEAVLKSVIDNNRKAIGDFLDKGGPHPDTKAFTKVVAQVDLAFIKAHPASL